MLTKMKKETEKKKKVSIVALKEKMANKKA